MFFKIYLTLHINVQSSQIWSAWEWCHWIGKSTRAIGFYFFTSHSWIYFVDKVLSSFIKSNLLHARFACAQTYLDWRTLVKKSAKILICFFFWFARNGILNSWGAVFQRAIYVSPTFLKHNYAEKKMQAHAKTMIRTCRRLYVMKLLGTLSTKYIQEW